MPSQAD